MKSLFLIVSLSLSTPLFAALCEEGRYNTLDGNDDNTPCLPCPLGTFADEPGAFACMDCNPGKFAGTTGSVTCTVCEPGTFQDMAGQASCEQCEAGTFASEAGSLSCASCPAGMTSVAASATCTVMDGDGGSGCAIGQIASVGDNSRKAPFDLIFLFATLAVAISAVLFAASRIFIGKRY